VAFCGDGPLRSEGEERFRGDDRIRFLGWQPRRITDALLAAASVVLVPMSGFVLLEAAAAGRPVIAGNLEWHGELIEDDRTGFLVPPRDVGAWADRIGRLLGAPLLRRRLGDALRQRFDSEYDPDRHRAREIALYKRLTSRPAGPMKRR
jgi:glycosyltransferase involved in cell wall biosynthesis